MTQAPDDTLCRLCHGATTFVRNMRVLDEHQVAYYVCQSCGSLQTQRPHWLAAAYANAASSIDPGAARRVLDSYVLVDVLARMFNCRKLLDFGGNTGLLCRLLRDRGYDAYSFDRYVTPTYAPHFVGSPSQPYDMVTSFEVIEHLESPAQELGEIFGPSPRLVLVTTELFRGQGPDWWYLAPLEGQHIFFYSEQALRLIAERYGYHLLIGRAFVLFNRAPFTWAQRTLIPRLLRPRVLRVLGAPLLMRSGHGAEQDFETLSAERRRTGGS